MLLDSVLDIGSKLIDRLIPDPMQKAQAQLDLVKLQQSGELAEMTAQTDINKVEAASASFFVAGWRPYIGWVCGVALTYQYIARPFLVAFLPSYQFPGLDENLWQLMMGMLGLGGLRSFEKFKGITK
jgi:Holin of 3TMs, for gene-transfer release